MPKIILTEEQRLRKNEASKKYYDKSKISILAKKRKYRLENRDKILTIQKKYRLKNRDIINKKQKKYRAENKDLITKRQKIYDKRSRLKSFILFIAQNFKIITEIVPNYELSRFKTEIVNLELI